MPEKPLVTFSAFADEISMDLLEEMACLAQNGIRHIELRQVYSKKVIDLSDAECRDVRKSMKDHGFSLSSIGSHIGKVDVRAPFEPHLEDYKRILDRAVFFESPFVRVFSYFMPKDEDASAYRSAVLDRMAKKADLALSAGVVLLHENEKEIFGDVPERCRDILATVAHPNLRAAFDPANFVQVGVDPFRRAWPILKEFVVYFHIKDARKGTGDVVKAGEGDGEFREILTEARDMGYRGFASMEPHLLVAGASTGFTGAEKFGEAVRAIKMILCELDFPYVEAPIPGKE
ncbi:MAG: sugar phosphate isomerase/epimerase family protein [Planctomycetota bacterium]